MASEEQPVFGVPSLDVRAIEELAARKQWVCWRTIDRGGKPTKVPINPASGSFADVVNPATWAEYATAVSALAMGDDFDGVGFVFTDDDPFIGIDVDKCRDPKLKRLQPWARQIIDDLASYTEISPSGSGVHIIVRAEMPGDKRRVGRLEIYPSKRFFTMTGVMAPDVPDTIEERSTTLAAIYANELRGDNEKPRKTSKQAARRKAATTASDVRLTAVMAEIAPVVKADTTLGQKKLFALLANDQDTAQVWQRRPPQEGWSPSEWDMALANKLITAGLDRSEIVAAMIQYRARHGDAEKLRPDYYARTLIAAESNRFNATREATADDPYSEPLPDHSDAGGRREQRRIILESLSGRFAVTFKDIIRYVGDPPMYRIITDQGEVTGEVGIVISQHEFRKAMANAARKIIAPMSKPLWNKVGQQMLDVARDEIGAAEATPAGQMRSWIIEFMEDQPTPAEAPSDEVLISGHPFFNNEQLFIVGQSFRDFLHRRLGVKLTGQKFGVMMRKAHCRQDTRSARNEQDRPSSRSVWRLPPDLAKQYRRKS